MTIEHEAPETLTDDQLSKALAEGMGEDTGDEPDTESPPPDGGPTGETVDKPTETPPAPESLEDRLAKLEKRLADKDKFIEERNAEIGKLRKQVAEREQPKKLHDVNSENFFDDPVANVEKITENKLTKLEQEQQRRMEEAQEEFSKRRETLKHFAPDYEQNVDMVVEVLKQDGFDEDGIKAFRSNPYAYETPLLYNLQARAKLAKENAQLKAELAQLRGTPKKLLDKVDAATRQRPKVTNATGAGASDGSLDLDSLDDRAISRLSDKQLAELINKQRRKK